MERAKRIFTLLVPALFVAAGCAALASVEGPGDRLYEMVFRRSFVQFITLYVFALAASLLAVRAIRYGRARREFAAQHGAGSPAGARGLLAEQLSKVRATLLERGGKAAIARADALAQAQAERIARGYEGLSALASLLPALGLFGTILGLSSALFHAFGGASGARSIEPFVTGLGTALDTTVLGALGAFPVFGFSWILCRMENDLAARQAAGVRAAFGLDDLERLQAETTAPRPDDASALPDVEVFRAELRAITAGITQEAVVAFGQALAGSVEGLRASVDAALNALVRDQKANQERAQAELAKSLGAIRTVVDQHGTRATALIESGLSRLAKLLRRRTPDEVIIRYAPQKSNGESSHEVSDETFC